MCSLYDSSHVTQQGAEKIREIYPEANKLINNIKKSI